MSITCSRNNSNLFFGLLPKHGSWGDEKVSHFHLNHCVILLLCTRLTALNVRSVQQFPDSLRNEYTILFYQLICNFFFLK